MLNAIKNDYHLRRVIGQQQNDEDAYIDQWAKTTAEKMLAIVKAQLKGEPIPQQMEKQASTEEKTVCQPEN